MSQFMSVDEYEQENDMHDTDEVIEVGELDSGATQKRQIKKFAIIGCILIACGLIVIGVASSLVHRARTESAKLKGDTQGQIERRVDKQMESNKAPEHPESQQSVGDGEVRGKAVWNEVNVSNLKLTENDGILTVVDIVNLISLDGENELAQLKSIIRGNIAGYEGVYEVEVSYDIASQLSKGTYFKIKYYTTTVNDKLIVVSILV